MTHTLPPVKGADLRLTYFVLRGCLTPHASETYFKAAMAVLEEHGADAYLVMLYGA